MKSNTWKHSITLLAVLAVALLGANSALAHKNITSSAISFSSNPASAGTLVTITGTVTFTGAQSTGSSGGHTFFPSAGAPVVGENAMIQRALDADGNHVACEDAVSFGDNFVGPVATDINGQISGVFDTTGLGGQTLGFRTHHPDGGGTHGASTSSSDCADLVITDEPEGCSHGFWKSHDGSGPQPSEWPGIYTPSMTLGIAGFVFPTELSGFTNFTLGMALDFTGGPGLDGAARILLRNAVASLLNAEHPDVDYPMTVTQVRDAVNTALASLDPATILALEAELDILNNLGCPLPLVEE